MKLDPINPVTTLSPGDWDISIQHKDSNATSKIRLVLQTEIQIKDVHKAISFDGIIYEALHVRGL